MKSPRAALLLALMLIVASPIVWAQDKIRITVAVQTLGDVHGDLEVALAERYMEMNPNVEIELVDGREVAVYLAGGIELDVIGTQTSADIFLNMGHSQVLEPLDALISEYGFREGFDINDIHPAMLEMHRVNGELHFMPYRSFPMLNYINVDLFEQMGVPLPTNDWTWEEYEDKLRRITRDVDGDGINDVWGGATDPTINTRLSAWIWQNGGDWFTEDRTKTLIDSREVITALEWLEDMYAREIHVPYQVTNGQWQQNLTLFGDGKVGVYGPVGIVTQYQAAPFEWDVIFPPQNEARATNAGNRGYVIHKNSKHKDVAWDFVQYLVSWESQLYRYEQLQVMGTHRHLATLPEIQSPQTRPASVRYYLDILPYSRALPQELHTGRVISTIMSSFRSIWSEGRSPQVVVNELSDAVNAMLMMGN